MSEFDRLRDLLKQAYDAGFNAGNGHDWGCTAEDFGNFEAFWGEISGGDMASALADMMDVVPDTRPRLQVGEPVPLENGDFVIEHIESKWDGDGAGHGLVHVLLQDRKSWDRKHQLYNMLGDDIPPTPVTPAPLPTIADWAKAAVDTTCSTRGCDRLAGHVGVHTNQP